MNGLKLHARSVDFGYSRELVLRDVTLRVAAGEVVSLLGPNGSGKTTLLKLLLGLYRPRSGEVLLDGKPVQFQDAKGLARKIAYVPQVHRMAFAYSALDMALMGRMPHKSFFSRFSDEDRSIALQALDRLGVADLRDRPYTEISGGERQLVLIARALTQGADTLVMDEPLNGLDYGNQIRLLEQISKLSREGYTFIQSTHFPDHALWIADHAVMLNHGAVVADGRPEEIMTDGSISRLYGAGIAILDMPNGLRTCVPRSLLNDPGRLARGHGVVPLETSVASQPRSAAGAC